LLANRIRIESYEAVAIVQALCLVTLESEAPTETARLDPDRIYIHPDGAVTALSAGPTDQASAVFGLGEILSQILPSKDLMFLRERVVAKATSSPPYYASVRELSDTLAYYERPDRTKQIRDVYDRWQGIGSTAAAPERAVRGRISPALGMLLSRNVNYTRVAAVGLVVLGTTALGWMLAVKPRPANAPPVATLPAPSGSQDVALGPGSPASRTAEPSSNRLPEQPAGSAPKPAINSVLESSVSRASKPSVNRVVEASGNRRTASPVNAPSTASVNRVPEASPSRSARLAGNPTPEPTQRTPKVSRSGSASTFPEKQPDAPVSVAESRVPPPPAAVSSPLLPPVEARPAPVAPEPERFNDDPGAFAIVYGANDTDVIPPVVLYSQLPGPSPLASPQHDVPALEVVVNERGTVDSVKAVARPRNIAESVVLTNGLSAAKAWRFRPALKDGHPVKYRLLIALTAD
jgi:hypothetical protein